MQVLQPQQQQEQQQYNNRSLTHFSGKLTEVKPHFGFAKHCNQISVETQTKGLNKTFFPSLGARGGI